MSWDYRALCPEIDFSAQGQGDYGGGNVFDNCVPAAVLLCAQMLTGHRLAPSPETITDYEYGPNYVGVEDVSRSLDYLRHVGFDPSTRAAFPVDPAAYIEEQGEQHRPMIYYVRCDAQAVIRPDGQFGHACCPIAGDGSRITLWANGFGGDTVTMTHAQVNAVALSGMTVFDDPIPAPATPAGPLSVEEDDMPLVRVDVQPRTDERFLIVKGPDGYGRSGNPHIHMTRQDGGAAGVPVVLGVDQGGKHVWHGSLNVVGSSAGPPVSAFIGEHMSDGEAVLTIRNSGDSAVTATVRY